MMTLAVTGGIGSGKSLVCSLFSERGVPVYDSDSRTKALYESEPRILQEIEEVLGTSITGTDGKPDRKKLASIIFSDKASMAALESVVHPAVLKDFIRWSSAQKADLVIMESAIVMDKPLFAGVIDKILLVEAPDSLRIKRAAMRDSTDEETVRIRVKAQGGGEKSRERADFIIENDSDIEDLRKKVNKIYNILTNK